MNPALAIACLNANLKVCQNRQIITTCPRKTCEEARGTGSTCFGVTRLRFLRGYRGSSARDGFLFQGSTH
jgi:hypothetical protein